MFPDFFSPGKKQTSFSELVCEDVSLGATPSNYCHFSRTSWTAPVNRAWGEPCVRSQFKDRPHALLVCCVLFWVPVQKSLAQGCPEGLWNGKQSAPGPGGAVCRIECHILTDRVTPGPAGADSEEMAVYTAVPVPTLEDMNSAAPVKAWLEGRGSPTRGGTCGLGSSSLQSSGCSMTTAPYVPVPPITRLRFHGIPKDKEI